MEAGNTEMGRKIIKEIIQLFKQNKLNSIHGSNEFINQFTRKKVTEKLAKVFDSVIKK